MRGESGQDGITDIADPALERQEFGWYSPGAHLLHEELSYVLSNPPAGLVRRRERTASVRLVGVNDANHLSRVDFGIGPADPVERVVNREGARCGGGGKTRISAISRSRGEWYAFSSITTFSAHWRKVGALPMPVVRYTCPSGVISVASTTAKSIGQGSPL